MCTVWEAVTSPWQFFLRVSDRGAEFLGDLLDSFLRDQARSETRRPIAKHAALPGLTRARESSTQVRGQTR
jgi:hypothetical protein